LTVPVSGVSLLDRADVEAVLSDENRFRGKGTVHRMKCAVPRDLV
jgi:hypothetical protein